MIVRLGQFLCCVALTSAPVFGAETWDCTFSPHTREGVAVRGTLEIRDDAVYWVITEPRSITSSSFQILENNDVGVVAIDSHSENSKSFGARIGAAVFTLNRANGDMLVGSVSTDGVRDIMRGQCRKK